MRTDYGRGGSDRVWPGSVLFDCVGSGTACTWRMKGEGGVGSRVRVPFQNQVSDIRDSQILFLFGCLESKNNCGTKVTQYQ